MKPPQIVTFSLPKTPRKQFFPTSKISAQEICHQFFLIWSNLTIMAHIMGLGNQSESWKSLSWAKDLLIHNIWTRSFFCLLFLWTEDYWRAKCDNFLESLKCLFFFLSSDMMMRIIISLQPETRGLICHQSKAPRHLLVPQWNHRGVSRTQERDLTGN